MNTQTKVRSDATTFTIDEHAQKIRRYVIYASSQIIGIDGAPIHQIPIDLVKDDGTAIARAMIKAAETYTDADGWLIEYIDAKAVPAEDMARLAKRFSHVDEGWDEFISLPENVCTECGGTGFLTMIMCDGHCEPYELRGDCGGCDSTGELR